MNMNFRWHRLLKSNRWLNFMESAAKALQVNITLVTPELAFNLSAPLSCPECHSRYPEFTTGDLQSAPSAPGNSPVEFQTEDGSDAIGVLFYYGLRAILRQCTCFPETGRMPLKEKAVIAQKFLTNFFSSLSGDLEGGQKAVELSTLRQMNHLVLSLFKRESKAEEFAFNLIISAVVLLLDAQGSWFKYDKDGSPLLITRGEQLDSKENLSGSDIRTVKVQSGGINGELGVLSPADGEQADILLPLMAQECTIVFEIKRLFELLRNHLNNVLGSVGSAVLLVNQYGNIAFANSAAANLLNLQTVDLIGTTAGNAPGPWTPYIVERTERNVSGIMDQIGQSGANKRVDWQVNPLKEQGVVAGWIIIAEDRTDYYRWQNAARKAERFATTAAMVGTLAHELRNPLSAAKGLVELMSRSRQPEKVRGYSDLILKEIDRVTTLLNEFLLLGRPAEIVTEPMDPVEFLTELLPLLKGESRNYGVELRTSFDTVPPVCADQGQLIQVILNLVRNALQAAGENGLVVLTLTSEDNSVRVSIKDNGPGLSPEVKEKLFKPFFTTKKRGTGLGLTVVRGIVHNHGGEIITANNPDGGAEFAVTLPAYTNTQAVHRSIDIMLIIENYLVRFPAEQALREAGFNVMSLSNCRETISLVERILPTIIIVDEKYLADADFEKI